MACDREADAEMQAPGWLAVPDDWIGVAQRRVPRHGHGMLRVVSILLPLALLTACDGFRVGRDNPQPSPGWVGHTVSDFAARNPAARQIYGQDALYVFENTPGYGKCEVILKTNGRVITDVVNLCAPGTLWLSAPSHRTDASEVTEAR